MQKQYLDANKDKFLNELLELLKIPSVSADPAYAKDVHKAAAWISTGGCRGKADLWDSLLGCIT